jgi:hypothetical protein
VLTVAARRPCAMLWRRGERRLMARVASLPAGG